MGSQTSFAPRSSSATPPTSHSSAHGSMENVAATGPASGSLKRGVPSNDHSCWVYVTIQLYCIERDSFMVDFKCAGYERLARTTRKEFKRRVAGEQAVEDEDDEDDDDEDDDEDELDDGFTGYGRYADEKDISSPFPFMDVASSLIVSLAQRD